MALVDKFIGNLKEEAEKRINILNDTIDKKLIPEIQKLAREIELLRKTIERKKTI